VWHELLTPDSTASHAFYSKVLGWKTQAWEHDPSYSMFAASSGPLGATVPHTEGRPHWRHYVSTPDLDATVQEATSLGASVVSGPSPLPDGGRYAVLTDPQGAVFALFSSPREGSPEKPPKVGQFSWLELATTDARAALDFYGRIFGWEKTAEHDMGPMGFYFLFGRKGREIGGAFNKPAEMPGPPGWLGYVRVKSVDKTVKKAKAAGATLLNGPMEVPGGDWIAQFADPQGAMFAIHALKADVQAAAAAPETAAAPPPPPPPAKVEVTAAPPKKAAPKKKAKAAKKAAKAKRPAAKAMKRSARKAAKVRSRPAKAKAAPRKKASGAKKKARATVRKRARKGK
ncbi:MAG TPA: VOC family protein, partial [Povalibacter sp.]|nr:VOC family protein [Povalibacter sp.]